MIEDRIYKILRSVPKKMKEWDERNRKKIYLSVILMCSVITLCSTYMIAQAQFMTEVYTNAWHDIGFSSTGYVELCNMNGCRLVRGEDIAKRWHESLYGSIFYIVVFAGSSFIGGTYVGRLWSEL